MKTLLLLITASLLFSQIILADNGLITIKSNYSVKVTTDRLEKILKEKGMTVFARINHQKNAKKVNKKLRATQVLIFGNPKAGTPLMKCSQTLAIDLPQKALIYKDVNGQVWLTYNDIKYIAKRHGVKKCEKVIKKIETALKKFAEAATKK